MGTIIRASVNKRKRQKVPAKDFSDTLFEELNNRFDGTDEVSEGLSFAAEVAQRVQKRGTEIIAKDDVHDIESEVELEGFYQRYGLSVEAIDASISRIFT
tara:strand:- start:2065 stop:2364 length:300 start_codon:yes stop_codon:yes gene_type:complete